MMKKTRYIRKKKIVNPRYQFKFAFFVIFLLVLYSLVFSAALFLPLAVEMQTSVTTADQARVAFVVLGLHEKIWPSLIGVLFLAFVGAILYSHRIVGPLVRLEKTVDEFFLKGDFTKRIRFRKTDELKEIETIFNRLADYLEKMQVSDRVFHADLKEKVQQLGDQLTEKNETLPDATKAAMASLQNELDARPDVFTRQS